jgi:hypothetical protein
VTIRLAWDNSSIDGSVDSLKYDTMTLSVTTSAKGKHQGSGIVTFGCENTPTLDTCG